MFIVFVVVVVFYAAFYYVFFVPKTQVESEEVAQSGVQDTSYQEYKDYVSDTNKGIKNLLDGEQLKQIVVHDEYPAYDLNLPKNENPFAKSF